MNDIMTCRYCKLVGVNGNGKHSLLDYLKVIFRLKTPYHPKCYELKEKRNEVLF